MRSKKSEDRSYFAIDRRRRKRNLMIFIPIAAAVLVTAVVLGSMSGRTLPGNQMVLHNHPRLNITSDGQAIMVPSNIGIGQIGTGADPLLYGDHSLDKYGMQGMSPLHTHDASGVIHVESNTMKNFTLGEFLDIWKGGPNTNGKNVQATVDGLIVPDYRNIVLKDGEKINLDIKS